MKYPSLRLVTGTLMIFGVLAAVAGVSTALFSDTVSIQNSTFATGTADLEIATDLDGVPGTYGDSILGADVSGMVPGQSEDFDFWLHNASGGTLSLDLSAIVNDISGGAGIRADLMVGFTCPDGSILPKSLDDWEDDLAPTGGLGTLTPADGTVDGTGTDEAPCTMTATLDSDSTASGESATFDAVFTGTQTPPGP